jgi:hypothetical protein
MLVGAVTASSIFALRCRVTGAITLDACCPAAVDPGAAPDEPAPAPPTVAEAGCCDRLVVSVAKPPAQTGDPPREGAPPPAPTTFAAATEPLSGATMRTAVARAARFPGLSPPSFLLRHALLI